LELVWDRGNLPHPLPDLETIRQRRIRDVEALDAGVRRLMYPHIYHVSLSQKLWNLKQELIEKSQPGMENNSLK